MNKLSLPNVTLCASTSQHIELTYRAMARCLEKCDFGDVVFISPYGKINEDERIRYEKMDNVSNVAEVAIWQYKNLDRFTRTEFNLSIHWDSWIIDPNAWNDNFFDYDYVAPSWPWFSEKNVGTEGFCLRSKKMLNVLARLNYSANSSFEGDLYICRELRPVLEEVYGIRFAPPEVGDRFCYETMIIGEPFFGFHALVNMHLFLNEQEMIETIYKFDDYMFKERLKYISRLIDFYKNKNRLDVVDYLKSRISLNGSF